MQRLVGIVCAALVFGPAACTITTGDPDGGTGSSSSGGSSSTRTLGEQCDDLDTEFCVDTSNQCGVLQDIQACVDGNRGACCVGSACNRPSTISESTVSSCKSGLDGLTCYELTQITNAASCLTQ